MVDYNNIPTDVLRGILKQREESESCPDIQLVKKLSTLPESTMQAIRKAESINTMKPSVKTCILDLCIDFLLRLEKYLSSKI